jgi:SulP family sulfate permease
VRSLVEDADHLDALVLDLEGVNFIDSQGAAKLRELHKLADADDVVLRLARVKPNVLEVLRADGLLEEIGADHIHGNVQRAVRAQLPNI